MIIIYSGFLVSIDVRKTEFGQIHMKRCAYCKSDHFVVCSNISATNGLTVKSTVFTRITCRTIGTICLAAIDLAPSCSSQIVIYLTDELRCGLCSVIERHLLTLAGILLKCGNSCDIRVEKIKHLVHSITDGDSLDILAGDLQAVCGVHKAYENNLSIRIEFSYLIDNGIIAQKEACYSVADNIKDSVKIHISEAFTCRSNEICLKVLVYCHNSLLGLFILKKCQTVLKREVRIGCGGATHNSYCISYSVNKERAEGSVTNSKSNNVCVSNSVLKMSLKLCIFISIIIAYVVSVTAPVVVKLLVSAAEEVEEVIREKRGRSKLGMIHIYFSALREILCELKSIRSFTVHARTCHKVVNINII